MTVDAARTSDAMFTPFTLTVSILGASVSPNPVEISSATVGVPTTFTATATNLFGSFTGRATGGNLNTGVGALGSAFIDTPSIANLEQREFPVAVTAGATSLRATIGGTSDKAADLDLFVFNCTSGTCVQAGSNADGDSEESVTIANPAAGEWLVVVDGYAVPAGTTTYNYVDVFVGTSLGTLTVTASFTNRPAGSSWTVTGSVTANAIPAAGRVLLGAVSVAALTSSTTAITVGQGDVVVQSVAQ